MSLVCLPLLGKSSTDLAAFTVAALVANLCCWRNYNPSGRFEVFRVTIILRLVPVMCFFHTANRRKFCRLRKTFSTYVTCHEHGSSRKHMVNCQWVVVVLPHFFGTTTSEDSSTPPATVCTSLSQLTPVTEGPWGSSQKMLVSDDHGWFHTIPSHIRWLKQQCVFIHNAPIIFQESAIIIG